MATTGNQNNQTVEIEITANAKKFRDELKKTASDANRFNKSIVDMRKASIKYDRGLRVASKSFKEVNKGVIKDSIDQEKKLIKLMDQRLDLMRKLKDEKKHETQEFKAARQELSKTATEYAKIRRQRAAAEQANGGVLGRIGGAVGRGIIGLGAGALGAGIGALTSRVISSGSASAQYQAGAINLAGGSGIKSIADLRRGMFAGARYGYDPLETAEHTSAVARATGSGKNTEMMQQFARVGMLDQGQATSFLGLQARGGVKNEEQAKRDLEKILASAFSTGLERERIGEHLEGLSSLVAGAQGRSAGDVSATGAAGSLALLGSTKMSGLTGARGADVLGRLEQGFQSGGGEAGRALALRSMGFGRGTSYFQALKRMDEGFTGEKGSQNLLDFAGELQGQYGKGSEASALALREMTGLSGNQTEAVLNAINQGGPNVKAKIAEITKGSGSLEKQTLEVLKGDLATQSIFQSEQQKKLVEEGDLVLKDLDSMKADMNKLISLFWPVAVKTLNLIARSTAIAATGIEDALAYYKSVWGDKMDPTEAAARSMAGGVLTNYRSGTIGSKQAQTELADIKARFQGSGNKTIDKLLAETEQEMADNPLSSEKEAALAKNAMPTDPREARRQLHIREQVNKGKAMTTAAAAAGMTVEQYKDAMKRGIIEANQAGGKKETLASGAANN